MAGLWGDPKIPTMKLDILNRLFGDPSLPAPLPRLEIFLTGLAIETAIFEGRPFLASRLGWEESTAVWRGFIGGAATPELRQKLWKHAGVFPDDPDVFVSYAKVYLEAIREVDLLGVMDAPYERAILEHLAADPILGDLGGLEPYLSPRPWSAALKDRKVLVVHPFAESIRSQFSARREQLFANPAILPSFDLTVIPAPQTIAGNPSPHADWSEAFRLLCELVGRTDFDVAIVGCGGYGLPLGAFIKDLGKTCIHIGGATQILFGIWGARWRGQAAFRALATGAWISPGPDEKPAGADSVENGCYW